MKIQLNQLGHPSENVPGMSKGVIVHFCKQCGVELFGEWDPLWDERGQKKKKSTNARLDAIEKARLEFKKIAKMDKCPVCGSKLSTAFGDSVVLDTSMLLMNDVVPAVRLKPIEDYDLPILDLSIENICAAMRKIRLKQQEEEAGKIADALFAQYESAEVSTVISGYEKIKENTDTLKGYLLHLIQVEANIFSLVSRLKALYAQRMDVDRDAYFSTVKPLIEARRKIEARQDDLTKHENALKTILSTRPQTIELPEPKKPSQPTEPQYAQPGFFNKKRVLAENAELKAKYEQALAKYANQMERYSKELEEWKRQFEEIKRQHEVQHQMDIEKAQQKVNAAEEKLAAAQKTVKDLSNSSSDIATPEKTHKAILDDEIQQAENMLKKAIHCKHELYNYNIIFIKYRNIVALSTIYEYLVSGRCTALDGANGAYNLYESELRANTIISQLNGVLESIDTIKDSQFTIYNAIQQANSSLHRLECSMSAAAKTLSSIDAKSNCLAKIAENSDIIAHNSAVAAHYSKINAELTDALGYMVAFS